MKPARKVLGVVLALLALGALVSVLLGGIWAVVHTESMTARVLPLLPGVTVVNPKGALLGDFGADRIDIALPRSGRLSLVQPSWRDLRVTPDWSVAWYLRIDVASLHARRLELVWVPGPAVPQSEPKPLRDVRLPVAVAVGRLQVDEAISALWGKAPLKAIDAMVDLQRKASPVSMHRIKLSQLLWMDWALQGEASIGVDKDMPVLADLHARNQATGVDSGTKEAVDAALKGPLAQLGVQARLALAPKDGPPESLTADAELAPFAAWPVSRLLAKADGVNLARLHPGLPETLLRGQVEMAPLAQQDLRLRLDLHNEMAGAWDLKRLPVRQVQGRADLAGARTARSLSEVWRAVQVNLSAAVPSSGGRRDGALVAQGVWGNGKTLDLSWQGVEPQALHGLAPPLQLEGALQLKPEWSVDVVTAPSEAVQAASKAASQIVSKIVPPVPPMSPSTNAQGVRPNVDAAPKDLSLATLHAGINLQAKGMYGAAFASPVSSSRTGHETASARAPAASGAGKAGKAPVGLASRGNVPVGLSLKGRFAPGRLDVAALSLRAQDAQADVSDAVVNWGRPAPEAAWSVKGRAKVQAFDPQVWLPWPAAMTGSNRLTGEVDVALDALWRGQLSARIEPSMLGGVPLSGEAQWRSPRDRQLMSLSLDANAGGNTIQAKAELPWSQTGPQGAWRWGAGTHWEGEVHAPALHTLQPVAPLLGLRQVAGLVEASFQGQGVWPALRTKGEVTAQRLQWLSEAEKPLGVASAKAAWSLDGTASADAPVRLDLDLAQAQVADLTVEKAQGRIDGSLRQHQGKLSADAVQKASDGAKPRAFHVGLAFAGGWQAQASTWQGRVSELLLNMTQAGAQPRMLLQAQPTDVSWRHGEDAQALHLSAITLTVLGAPMHLRKLDWNSSDADGHSVGDTDIVLDLDPLNLPLLLASWQPQAGWGGDLMLVGQLKLRHSASTPWTVDATVSRQSGDISLSEPTIQGNSAQRLGIKEARVTLQARDGVWALSEYFEGRIVGVLKGRQVVRAASPGALPVASDPLSGELDLQISNLRPWGTWAPAGWRLTGQLQAKAEVAGTLGVPQYRGQVHGQNLGLGQALMGVNLTDGVLDMTLEGDRVTLSRLTAQGGAQGGSISAQGYALIDEHPKAELSVKAERFALLQRVDRRIVISGEAQSSIGDEDIKVDGRAQVDEGLIDITRSDAPTIGEDVNVVNRPGQPPEEESDAGGGAAASKRKLNANVSVDLGHKLRLKGRGLDAFLAGNLRLSTPGNRPAINGIVHVENGTYAAYGQKLVIERGDVAFTGPIENPRLDILAMRAQSATATESDVKVGVNITGTAQDPRVRLYSEPAMSETDKLSWLVLGRAPTGLGGADIGLLQSAAVALLQGENSSPSDGIVSKLGLDDLSVRQSEGAGSVRDTVVNLGKQVSKYWYVGYERNLNATSGNWQLIYRLAQRITVRAQAGDDNAVDIIRSWKWD